MGFGFGRRNTPSEPKQAVQDTLPMDGDNKVSDKELAAARAQALQIFEKKLGRNHSNHNPLITFYDKELGDEDPKLKNHMSVTVRDSKSKEKIGVVLIDKRTGEYTVESASDGKAPPRARIVKEEPAPAQSEQKSSEPLGHRLWNGLFGRGDKGEHAQAANGGHRSEEHLGHRPGDGKYHLIREMHERGAKITVKGKSFGTGRVEYGALVIVDPSGKELLRETYVSGPTRHGMIADKNTYPMDSDVKPFTVEGGGQLQGHRISGSRYLVHQELGAPGTAGCFGLVADGAMERYKEVWQNIPRNQRPDSLDTERGNINERQMSQDRAMLAARGLDLRGVTHADTAYVGNTPNAKQTVRERT